jgi:hypothetical protein
VEHQLYDSLQYVIFYSHGGTGWQEGLNTQVRNTEISIQDFYKHMLMVLDPKEVVLHYDTLHHGKMLFQKFVVDQAVKMQDNSLQYLASSSGQQQIRANTYNSLQDAIRNEAGHQSVGRAIILPSTFPGGPRYMREKYQDAMAIVRDEGSLSYFISMTTNPTWEELMTALKPITALVTNIITARIMGGPFNETQEIIPRITLSTAAEKYPFELLGYNDNSYTCTEKFRGIS